jgi:hypothetical protein
MDFMVLPELIFRNLNGFPKLFKNIYPEAYVCEDLDLHMQLAGSVSVIMNRRIQNPHMRIEFLQFLLHIMPQKNVSDRH